MRLVKEKFNSKYFEYFYKTLSLLQLFIINLENFEKIFQMSRFFYQSLHFIFNKFNLGVNINNWGSLCKEDLNLAKDHIILSQRFKDENVNHW